MEEVRKNTMAFSELICRLSKKVKFKYFIPQELQEMRQAISGGEEGIC